MDMELLRDLIGREPAGMLQMLGVALNGESPDRPVVGR